MELLKEFSVANWRMAEGTDPSSDPKLFDFFFGVFGVKILEGVSSLQLQHCHRMDTLSFSLCF